MSTVRTCRVLVQEAQTLARPVLQLLSEELIAPCDVDSCGQQTVAASRPKLCTKHDGQHKKHCPTDGVMGQVSAGQAERSSMLPQYKRL